MTIILDTLNAHDKAVVEKFNKVAENFTDLDVLQTILVNWCDDTDLNDIADKLLDISDEQNHNEINEKKQKELILFLTFLGMDIEKMYDFENFNMDWNFIIKIIKQIREIVNTEFSIDEYSESKGLVERLNPYNYDIESVQKGCLEFIKGYNFRKGQEE